MLRFLLLIAAIFLSLISYGQDIPTDTTLAKIYTEKANSLKNTHIDSAIFYFNKAATIFKKVENWQEYGKSLASLGRLHKKKEDYKTACKLLHQANKSILQNQLSDAVFLAKNYNYLAFIYIRELNQLDSAKINLEKTIKLLEEKNIPDKNIAYAYKELGNIFHRKEKIKQAEIYLNKALNTYQTINNKSGEIGTLLTLALLYRNTGKAEKTFKNTGKAEKALQIFNQILKEPAAKPEQRGIAANNLVDLLMNKGQVDEALKNIDTAINIFKKIGKKDWLSAAYGTKASIFTKQKKWAESVEFLQKAIELQDTISQKNRDLGRLLNNLACLYQEKGKFAEALLIHQQSLQAHIPNFKPIDAITNPSAEVLQAASSEPRIIESLQAKAQTFWQQYQQNQQLNSLENALNTYTLTVQQIDLVKQQLDADKAKEYLHEVFYPVYENALQVALIIYEIKKEIKYLEQAFHFSEKNKASILLAAIKEMEAEQNANIPDSLLQQEQKYKQKLIDLQYQKAKTSNLESYNNFIFEYNKLLTNTKKEIKNHFPTYTNYYKFIPTSSATQLQIQLSKEAKKTALLEYFIGDSTIYTFAITDKEFTYTATPKPNNFDTYLNQLRDFLKAPNTSQQSYEQYTSIAYQLYQILLQANLETLSNDSKVERLIIVPDGKLAYIPFEILLTRMPKVTKKATKYRLSQLDYLLEKYVTTYAPSATLWQESLDKKSDPTAPITSNYVGFCPQFEAQPDSLTTKGCSGEILSPLEYPTTVTDICQLFGGQAYMMEKANKKTFEQKSGDSKILHLYTHACVNDADPMKNQIFFTDAPAYNYELYGLQLNADLAVLTACKTGVGELIKGEGIMSLSRAFMYAGCPSVVTSLWKAHDGTTHVITKQFYQNLYDGLPKDVALQQARLDFLENKSNNSSIHPFHWASFIHIGNHQSVDLQQNKWWKKWWLWGALLLTSILILGLWRIFIQSQ